jgi:hypothetical protein
VIWVSRGAHARKTVLDDEFAVLAQDDDVLHPQAPDGLDLGTILTNSN